MLIYWYMVYGMFYIDGILHNVYDTVCGVLYTVYGMVYGIDMVVVLVWDIVLLLAQIVFDRGQSSSCGGGIICDLYEEMCNGA